MSVFVADLYDPPNFLVDFSMEVPFMVEADDHESDVVSWGIVGDECYCLKRETSSPHHSLASLSVTLATSSLKTLHSARIQSHSPQPPTAFAAAISGGEDRRRSAVK
ncbi:hypothetical protein NL676_026715 [Syzygium grande]|nr:hypothetical protein NL676_026715 [Syzygium grande]